ncbi:aldehyde dehydrogenase family protein [Arthrobacter sp. D1-29]
MPAAIERLLSDPRVSGVSITGSVRACASVVALADRKIKNSLLELGSPVPFVVLDDVDLQVAGACVENTLYQYRTKLLAA